MMRFAVLLITLVVSAKAASGAPPLPPGEGRGEGTTPKALRSSDQPTSAARPKSPTEYFAVGAPAKPKVPASWNQYHDYAAATSLLKALAAAHPDRYRLRSLGRSYGGREMWVLTVTNFSRGQEADKPAFWIDGGIHANEIQATEVVLYTSWFLAESYGRLPLVTRLLDERVFYLMPMMSPDSRDAHMYEPNTTHSPRGGLRPVDDDRDGLVDEDKPDDLDGDGQICQMRVADAHGRWKPHPDYPALLVEAKPDEPGQYTLLGEEGVDNDGDGRVNEDEDGYYDPNRDWPWMWQPESVQTGAGNYPLSVPENRLVADFVMAHPNISGAQSYHNAGGMILRGPAVKADRYHETDIGIFTAIARQGEMMLPGYRYLETGTQLYEAHGIEFDWLYQVRGVLAYTNELFTPMNYFRTKNEHGYFGSQEQQRRFDKYLLLGQGVRPWHSVDHPQYGKVEVGGLSKNWMRQPPSFLLEEECHRNMAFTMYHADQMPLVAVNDVRVQKLEGGVWAVSATVSNNRLMPTRLKVDELRKISPPDVVTISGKRLKVSAGLISEAPYFIEAKEQRRRPTALELDSIPGMQARYVRWIVTGSGPFTVSIRSAKGGRSEASGKLPE